MTRINVGMPPMQLTQQHLLSEHREMKRIPNAVRRGNVNMVGIPKQFTLGTGHVRFFYNKLGWLLARYRLVYEECIKRGYAVQDYSGAWDGLDMGELYIPTKADIELIKQRIDDKLRRNPI